MLCISFLLMIYMRELGRFIDVRCVLQILSWIVFADKYNHLTILWLGGPDTHTGHIFEDWWINKSLGQKESIIYSSIKGGVRNCWDYLSKRTTSGSYIDNSLLKQSPGIMFRMFYLLLFFQELSQNSIFKEQINEYKHFEWPCLESSVKYTKYRC